jgi:hypothetical protein
MTLAADVTIAATQALAVGYTAPCCLVVLLDVTVRPLNETKVL